jgi:hypothetical protein
MQPASEPHFGGWPTRFVLWVRSKGAPFEETVILPALIVVVAGVLVDRGKIAPWVAIVAFLVPISISALWMGVALGPEGLIRILLRSVLIGVMEGVVFVTLAPAPLDKQQVMQTTLSCVYINIFLCWFCAVIGNVIGAFAITSEANREVGGAGKRSL